jgi:hypothetical protein
LSTLPNYDVESNCFFVDSEPNALKQLAALYAGRCFACWKAPEVIEWLEQNVQRVLDLVDNGDPRAEEYKRK